MNGDDDHHCDAYDIIDDGGKMIRMTTTVATVSHEPAGVARAGSAEAPAAHLCEPLDEKATLDEKTSQNRIRIFLGSTFYYF